MEKQRKKYTREFKLEAVRLLTRSDMTIAQASRDLGINPNLSARWKKEFQSDDSQAFPVKGHLKPDEEELRHAASSGSHQELYVNVNFHGLCLAKRYFAADTCRWLRIYCTPEPYCSRFTLSFGHTRT